MRGSVSWLGIYYSLLLPDKSWCGLVKLSFNPFSRYITLSPLPPSAHLPPPALTSHRPPHVMATILPTTGADERTPLTAQNGYGTNHQTFGNRVSGIFKQEGQPSWLSSFRFFFFGSWLNVMLVFVPLSVISHHANWDAALRFSFSFIAIMPLAAVRPHVQTRLAKHLTVPWLLAIGYCDRTALPETRPDVIRPVERVVW